MKFYKIDDQIVISDKALTVGEEIIANTTDGAHEKHVPVITTTGDEVKVEVGSVEHPSLPTHYIEWILLETEAGFQIHYLKPIPYEEFKDMKTVDVAALVKERIARQQAERALTHPKGKE